jgi:hypothetical protein
MTGEALRCQGLIEDDPGILQAAADAHARGSCPLRLALASENAGSAFARHGRAERALPLLDQAVGIYERLGAVRDLARAEAALREAGIRRGRRGTRSRPQFGWHGLTPTEHSVGTWSPRGCPIPRSARACISHTGPPRHTSRTSSPSWTFPHARSLPPRSPGGGATRWADDALPAATAAYTRLSSRTLVTWPVPHTLAISRSTTSVTDRALAIAAPGDRPASPARPASGRAAAVPANAKPTVMPTTNGPAWKRTAT